MLNDKVMLEVFWNESGSFLVDVPRDKEEEFCSYWNNERYDMSPQLYEFHYGEEPTEFEVYLKEIGGEVIGGNDLSIRPQHRTRIPEVPGTRGEGAVGQFRRCQAFGPVGNEEQGFVPS